MTESKKIISYRKFLDSRGIGNDRNKINSGIVELAKLKSIINEDDPDYIIKNDLIDSTLPFYKKGNIEINGISVNDYPGNVIKNELNSKQVIILKAGTGIGKSTQIVRIFDEKEKVIMTQPRRLISRKLAEKLALQRNQSIGEDVGFIIGDLSVPGKYVNVVTEGILIQLLSNKASWDESNYKYIILDEVHERTANMDLILFFLRELLKKNTDIRIIVMSATFKPTKFYHYFGPTLSTIVEISGQTAKIDVNYLNESELVSDYLDKAVEIINNLPARDLNEKVKDVLVFLPTIKLINELEGRLLNENESGNGSGSNLFITKLYSGIDKSYELLATSNLEDIGVDANTRRIILSTDVSETGFTFTSLKYVIDSGWVNKSYYDPIRDCNILMLDAISKSTALQRWGRVGRIAPGVVYTLYTRSSFDEFDNNIFPQLYGSNLDKAILNILNYGQSVLGLSPYDINRAKLIDQPPIQSVNRSLDTLNKLYLIDSDCKLTKLGESMNFFRENPRFIKCLFASVNFQCVFPMCIVISMIGVGMNSLIDRRMFNINLIDNTYQSDHLLYLQLYDLYSKNKNDLSWCHSNGFKWKSFEQVENNITSIATKLMEIKIPLISRNMDLSQLSYAIKRSILAGFGDYIAIQSDYDKKLYISKNNNEIVGTVSDSFVFNNQNRNLIAFYPKYIIYNQLILKKAADGIMKYNFNIASGLNENVFFIK